MSVSRLFGPVSRGVQISTKLSDWSSGRTCQLTFLTWLSGSEGHLGMGACEGSCCPPAARSAGESPWRAQPGDPFDEPLDRARAVVRTFQPAVAEVDDHRQRRDVVLGRIIEHRPDDEADRPHEEGIEVAVVDVGGHCQRQLHAGDRPVEAVIGRRVAAGGIHDVRAVRHPPGRRLVVAVGEIDQPGPAVEEVLVQHAIAVGAEVEQGVDVAAWRG